MAQSAIRIRLPDCRAVPAAFRISELERVELLHRLAEESLEGKSWAETVRGFVAEASRGEGDLADSIRQMRERLERQSGFVAGEVEAGRRRAEAEGRERAASARERLDAALADRIAALEVADGGVRIEVPADVVKTLELTLWARFLRWLRRIWLSILRLFRREREAPAVEPGPKRAPPMVIELPSLEGIPEDEAERRVANLLLTSRSARDLLYRRMAASTALGRLGVAVRRRFSGRAFLAEAVRRLRREATARRKEVEKSVGRLRRQFGRRRERVDARLDARLKRYEEEARGALERYRSSLDDVSLKRAERTLMDSLESAGFIVVAGDSVRPTTRLVDRFAEGVLARELGGKGMRPVRAVRGAEVIEGEHEKGRLQMAEEIGRMDIAESVIAARIHHPWDRHIHEEDAVVKREARGTRAHIVLAFDKSSSMEENRRMAAAKRAVLALYRAVKRRNRRNTVDLIAFDTSVRVMDMVQVWEAKPGGFTNTGEALRVARRLFGAGGRTAKALYIITDGLPEAYTDGGKEVAGDMGRSLDYALAGARDLRRMGDVQFTLLLMEPRERVYVDAANRIAQAAGGRVVVTDPQHLASEMLTGYLAEGTA